MLVLALLVGVGAATTAPDLGALLDAASQARARGDWAGAERLLAEAYRMKAAPEILYNRARAAEAMDQLPLAAGWYQALAADATISPEIRGRAAEHADRLSKLLGSGLLRLESGTWQLDGAPVSPGLISVSTTEAAIAVSSRTHTWWRTIRPRPGEVTRLDELELKAQANACLALGNRGVLRIDGAPATLSTAQLCLPPGRHQLLWSDGSTVDLELAEGTNTLDELISSGAPVPSWILWLASGGALTGGAVAIGVGAASRSSVIDAQQDAQGRVVSQSQPEAFEAQARGDTAMTVGVVLVSSAAVLALAGLLTWFIER